MRPSSRDRTAKPQAIATATRRPAPAAAEVLGTKALQYVALAGYLFVLGFPLLWLVSASFKSSRELNSLGANLIPREWVFTNYVDALERQNLINSIGNSLIVARVHHDPHDAARRCRWPTRWRG